MYAEARGGEGTLYAERSGITRTNLCTRPHSDSSPWACPLKVLFGVAKLLAVCCLLLAVPYLLPVSCALSSICSVWPIFYLLAWRAVGSNLPRTRHAAHELMGMTRIPPPCQQPRKDSAWARAASLPGWMEVLPPGRRARGSRRAVGRWQHARGAQSARRTRSRAARQVVRSAGAGRRAVVQAAHARGAAGALGTLRFVPPFRAAFPPARPSSHPPARKHAPTRTAPGCYSSPETPRPKQRAQRSRVCCSQTTSHFSCRCCGTQGGGGSERSRTGSERSRTGSQRSRTGRTGVGELVTEETSGACGAAPLPRYYHARSCLVAAASFLIQPPPTHNARTNSRTLRGDGGTEGRREGGKRQETCLPTTRLSGLHPRPLPPRHLCARERHSVHTCASAGARYTWCRVIAGS